MLRFLINSSHRIFLARCVIILHILIFYRLHISAQWIKVYGPISDYANSLCFINDSVGFAVVGRMVDTKQDFFITNTVLKTNQYGETWDTIYHEINYCPCAGVDLHYFTSVFFLNELEGWACRGSSDKIIRTTDGGESWEEIDTGLSESGLPGSQGQLDFQTILFVDSAYGVLQNGMEGFYSMETFDGGSTWSLNDELKGYGISVIDACNLGTTSAGYLNTISDCVFTGRNFPTAFDQNISRHGYFIHYWDDQRFISSGYGNVRFNNFACIVSTHDGGQTYDFIDIPGSYTSRDLKFYNEYVGYVSNTMNGNNPDVMLKTLDGGTTWYSIQVEPIDGVFPSIGSLNCPSENVGYGIGGKYIYRTLNGGGPLGNLYTSVKQEHLRSADMLLYPNPTTSGFSLSCPALHLGEKVDWKLIDVTGKSAISGTSTYSNPLNLDTHGLASGVYYLQLQCEEWSATKAVVVE